MLQEGGGQATNYRSKAAEGNASRKYESENGNTRLKKVGQETPHPSNVFRMDVVGVSVLLEGGVCGLSVGSHPTLYPPSYRISVFR